MSSLAEFLRPGTIVDADAMRVASQAFDRACVILHFENRPRTLKEALATLIVQFANTGQRDPDRLCGATLESIAGYRPCGPGLGVLRKAI